MAQARSRSDWSRVSSLMALIANVNRDPKKTRAFRPADFDPHQERQRPAAKVNIDVLKAVFVDREGT